MKFTEREICNHLEENISTMFPHIYYFKKEYKYLDGVKCDLLLYAFHKSNEKYRIPIYTEVKTNKGSSRDLVKELFILKNFVITRQSLPNYPRKAAVILTDEILNYSTNGVKEFLKQNKNILVFVITFDNEFDINTMKIERRKL